MIDLMEMLLRAALIGAGGAAMMDAWGVLARRAFGLRGLDYALLGRWIGHLPRRRSWHHGIMAAPPIPGERAIGWAAHYSIGMAFAVPLLAIWGSRWAEAPTVWPPIVVGLVTVLAPWLVMQPAMGAGIAASRSPQPWVTRLRNVATHLAYGLGLYVAAVVLDVAWPPGT